MLLSRAGETEARESHCYVAVRVHTGDLGAGGVCQAVVRVKLEAEWRLRLPVDAR